MTTLCDLLQEVSTELSFKRLRNCRHWCWTREVQRDPGKSPSFLQKTAVEYTLYNGLISLLNFQSLCEFHHCWFQSNLYAEGHQDFLLRTFDRRRRYRSLCPWPENTNPAAYQPVTNATVANIDVEHARYRETQGRGRQLSLEDKTAVEYTLNGLISLLNFQ